MTRQWVREYAASVRPRYQGSGKKVTKAILDEFCASTGRHRKAALKAVYLKINPAAQAKDRPASA